MSAGTDNLPPRAAVSQMATGYWVSQAVRAMAVLSLADHLASGPRTAADLAEATGAHAPSLARLLRALVALGLCGREATERFRLTPLGEALRSDVPDSARSFVLFFTAPWFERGWEELPHAVRTGEPTFPRVHGAGFWDYLGAHPEDGALFDAAMSEGASARAEALRAVRDLSSIGTVVDVGGGQGRLLAGLLEATPGLSGVLLDRPEVVAGAEAVLRAAGGGRPLRRRRWRLLCLGPPGRGCLRPGLNHPRLARRGSDRDPAHLSPGDGAGGAAVARGAGRPTR